MSTAVAFHFNAPDKLGYACRLLRKVYRSGQRAVVVGEPQQLDHLTRRLWEFDPQDFIPHERLKAGAAPLPRLRHTPLWLADEMASAPDCAIVVNLGQALPEIVSADGEPVERLIEIVSNDPDDRAAARERWRHYAAQGWAIEKHEVPA